MRKTTKRKKELKDKDELLPEYRFERSKLKPNRFAARMPAETIAVVLEPDVAAVFKSAKTVTHCCVRWSPRNSSPKASEHAKSR